MNADNAWAAMTGRVDIVGGPEIMLGDPAMAVNTVTEADKGVAKYVKEAGYTASDRIRVGVGATATIAAGATHRFQVQVNTPFKPEHVCVPSFLQPGFMISQVRIGATMLIDGDPVDSSCWSEVSQQAQVSWPTADTSQNIIIDVLNADTVAKTLCSINLYGVRLRK